MARYVALLRGINVGGNNLIKMAALKACFERHGLTDVATLIQSGNVVFTASKRAPQLTKEIEALLSKTFAYQASIVLRSEKQMAAIVAGAPKGFGQQPAKYRSNVLFLKDPLKPAAVLKAVPPRAGVDTADAGPGVVYFSNLVARATQSHLRQIIVSPLYKQVTIRNWNTTTKILQLLGG